MSICTRNRTVTALRFLFRVTLRRLDLLAELYHIKEPEKVPLVMSQDETKRLLAVAANRAANIARARELLGATPSVVEPEEHKVAALNEPRVLPCPCPRCGGQIIIIEVFAPGCEPKYRPAPAPTPIRIDTS